VRRDGPFDPFVEEAGVQEESAEPQRGPEIRVPDRCDDLKRGITMYELLAEVVRNGFVESVHFGAVAGLGPDGTLAYARGDVAATVFPRSAVKPFQALACLTAGAPLSGERLAIAAGSHTGQDLHVKTVETMLADAGLGFEALRCPPSWPQDTAARTALIKADAGKTREHMNCSGKHAAMLSACVANGWPTESYLDPAHPLQQRIRTTLGELAGEWPDPVAVDGCGAPLLGLSLSGLARATRALAMAEDGPLRQVAEAIRQHPEYVAGDGHVNTELMRALPGVIAKGGAEGVLITATRQGHAVAVKVGDGSPRATTAIALAALEALGADVSGAGSLRTVPVLGGGRPVGEIRPCS
jgi:L-asparaginase II